MCRLNSRKRWILILGFASLAVLAACAYMVLSIYSLTRASIAGDAERVRELLALGRGPDIRSSVLGTDRFTSWTPLMWALYYGHYDVIEALLDAGADPNHRSRMGERPLDIALQSQRRETNNRLDDHDIASLVRLLLAYGADPSPASGIGSTPLHTAARQGRVSVVEALLEGGASVHAMGDHATTPLRTTLWSRKPSAEVVRLLLEYGADPTIGDNPEIPLREVIASGRLQLDPEIIRMLEPYFSE